MLAWIKKHKGASAIALGANLPPLWSGIKWAWDWLGRIDLITGHMPDLAWASRIIGFLTNPPPWAIFPSVIFGVAVILYDARRQAKKAESPSVPIDPNKRLVSGFFMGCAAVAVAIWIMALSLYPASLIGANTPPKPPEAPKPPPAPPPPSAPWVTLEESEVQRKLGRPLLVYPCSVALPWDVFPSLLCSIVHALFFLGS